MYSVNQMLKGTINFQKLRIAHPGGVLEAGVNYTIEKDGELKISDTFGFRTANLLMDGVAYCS